MIPASDVPNTFAQHNSFSLKYDSTKLKYGLILKE